LNGTLGELFISSHGVALDPETAIVNKVLLKDTDLSLCLNDTLRPIRLQATPLIGK